ncbi:LuxR C-terminal-related transcriptional regulator [Ruficoccus sp. ZRK36]|uniref:helix-turn-helix transcriptional regulator n=1 Tax=Ruficoccus sp. ZRK36 TaxID=2866311 RepID=UPI001C73DBB7|nr:LuxR C-terminal-related transcriptional regulator [Ruficoccus sp. ZRK36]QYY35241.1 LuxR C-terminal-related transcriptional regulator [Ruficoccus sp. ZRK36]
MSTASMVISTFCSVANQYGISSASAEALLDLNHKLDDPAVESGDIYNILLQDLKRLIPCDWCSISLITTQRQFIGAVVHPTVNFDYATALPALDATLHEQQMLAHIERNGYTTQPVHQEEAFLARGLNYLESSLYREAYRLLDCRDQIGMVVHNDDVLDIHSSCPVWASMNFCRGKAVFSNDSAADSKEVYLRILRACDALVLRRPRLRTRMANFHRDLYIQQQAARLHELGEDRWADGDHFNQEFLRLIEGTGNNEISRWASLNLLVSNHGDLTKIQRYAQSERIITLSGGISRLVRMHQTSVGDGFTRRFSVSSLNDFDPVVSRMSKRQKEVIAGLTLGYNTETIAQKLKISRRTVESHIYTVQSHLGIPDGDFDKRIVIALRFRDHPEITQAAIALRML